MLSLLLLVSCGGNSPTSEPASPPEVQVSAFESKDKVGGEQPSEHEEAHHGSAHSEGVVDPGPIGEGAVVAFSEPVDGASVVSPVKVVMTVTGMIVQPAGEMKDGTGHHHVIIDSDPVPKGTVVASDEKHLHFGKGQTEAELVLDPGEHTLQLQFANGAHISYGQDLSSTITINVTQ